MTGAIVDVRADPTLLTRSTEKDTRVRWSWRVVTVLGLNLRLHVSLVLLPAWAAFHWGHVARGGMVAALFGVLLSLMLLTSVAVHEMAHGLQARYLGMRVRDVTLLPIGGLTRIDMLDEPGHELLVALAGPAANITTAVALASLALLFDIHLPSTVSQFFQLVRVPGPVSLLVYALYTNLVLGFANLLPVLPMDGGRALHAALSIGPHPGAAELVTMRTGQGCAAAFAVGGILLHNPWLSLLCLPLWVGASLTGRFERWAPDPPT